MKRNELKKLLAGVGIAGLLSAAGIGPGAVTTAGASG
ncbi:SbtA family thio(seleno)oxazole RiPP natural product precursor [Desulfobacterota bacterium M19]